MFRREKKEQDYLIIHSPPPNEGTKCGYPECQTVSRPFGEGPWRYDVKLGAICTKHGILVSDLKK